MVRSGLAKTLNTLALSLDTFQSKQPTEEALILFTATTLEQRYPKPCWVVVVVGEGCWLDKVFGAQQEVKQQQLVCSAQFRPPAAAIHLVHREETTAAAVQGDDGATGNLNGEAT